MANFDQAINELNKKIDEIKTELTKVKVDDTATINRLSAELEQVKNNMRLYEQAFAVLGVSPQDVIQGKGEYIIS